MLPFSLALILSIENFLINSISLALIIGYLNVIVNMELIASLTFGKRITLWTTSGRNDKIKRKKKRDRGVFHHIFNLINYWDYELVRNVFQCEICKWGMLLWKKLNTTIFREIFLLLLLLCAQSKKCNYAQHTVHAVT